MEKFWVVSNPTRTSTLADCVYETTTREFMLQTLGGLSWDEQEPKIHAARADALLDLDRRLKRVTDQADTLRMEIDAALNQAAEADEEAPRG